MTIIAFLDWTFRGKWGPTRKFVGPAIGWVIHHSVTNPGTAGAKAGARAVEAVIWSRRIKSFFVMIAYSYLVYPDGTVLEGRGTAWRNGANGNKKGGVFKNSNTLSICFIGNHHAYALAPSPTEPTDAALKAAGTLIAQIETEGHVLVDAPVMPHSDLAYTSCCGDMLTADIGFITEYALDARLPQGLDMELHVPSNDLEAAKKSGMKSRLWIGSNYFETSSVKHWSGRAGVTVIADQNLPTVWAGLKPGIAQSAPIPARAPATADSIADRVVAKIASAWQKGTA